MTMKSLNFLRSDRIKEEIEAEMRDEGFLEF